MPPARTRHKQVLLFDAAPCPVLPQWGGHGGLGPRLSRLVRVLHLVAEQPQALEDPQWWFKYGTQAMGTSSLYWLRALKLVDLLEDGSYRLSSNGQRLMEADPYLEGLGGDAASTSPLLWVLHWWMVSAPCLSRSISWMLQLTSTQGFWKNQQDMSDRMEQAAAELVSRTALLTEVKMLIDSYLPNPEAGWEAALDHPFWKLGLIQYWDVEPQVDSMVECGWMPTNQGGKPSKPQTASRKKMALVRREDNRIPPLAIAYAVLDHALSLTEGQHATGCIGLSRLLWKDWEAPGIKLRFGEQPLDNAVDQLKKQRLLAGLVLDYLPDVGGAVMQWTRPLDQMREEIWESMMS